MLALSADRKVNPGALNIDGFDWSGVFIGPDPIGLGGFEVAVAISDHVVSPAEIRQLHRLRLDGRDTNLVVAVVFGDNVTLFGPDPGVLPQMQPLSAAERKLQAALNEPDTSQAMRRFLALSDSESSGQMAGVRNRGLFASYHLRENVSKRADWSEMLDRSEKLLDSRGRQLIEDLGFTIAEQANDAFVLADSSDESRAVALLLDDSEFFDHESPRFHSSPVAWGLGIAAEKGLPWLIMLRHEQIRLYPAKDGVGVGQKGQTETYLELDLAGIAPAYYGLLSLIFSASALAQDGTAQQLLEESNRYATGLGVRLRDRIYTDVVPDLARAVANHMKSAGNELDSKGLQDAYRTTLRILFRILFQAYAEDRGLLPLERNPHFYEKSLTAFARAFLEGDASYGEGTGLWDTLQDVWTAIDEGNPEWSVPAYNGGLFGSDPERRPYGALIKSISLPDSVVGPALSKLLVDQSGDGVLGMIDFRSLSVREFGTIYEGLLESSLSLADTDLTLDANGMWLPAQDGDTVEARAGEPYFHNTSGERKATGSYFTPDFIVDHLIERAIDPTLDAHLERISALLQEGKHSEAAKNFFDYRVADIAMGSAHFLVAAVDRIESKMRTFLAAPENAIPGVKNELERLAEAARVALGSDLVAIEDIDEAVLLRRQIARRCIYGIDINPLAVELARLAIWIHTFVPGLPMSTLDHNLVCANSLTGIGSISEAEEALELGGDDSQLAVFDTVIRDALEESRRLLSEWSDAAEATRAEVSAAEALAAQAEKESVAVRRMLDVALASVAGVIDKRQIVTPENINNLADDSVVKELIDDLNPAHMPYLFPEVFVRDNPGFDAIVGNPPWETLSPDERKFWALRFPGLMSKPVSERKVLINGYRSSRPDLVAEYERESDSMRAQRSLLQSKFPLGAGDTDLSEAFAWNFFYLLRAGGKAGIVMPKTAFSSQGLAEWRRAVLSSGAVDYLTTIVNSGQWAFNIHPQFSIGLGVLSRGKKGPTVINGPFHSRENFEVEGYGGATWDPDVLLKLTESSAFPNVGNQASADVLSKMRQATSFADWEALGIRSVRELDSTNDRRHFDHENPTQPVTVLSGRGFNIWTPFTGEVFATAEYETVKAELLRRLERQSGLKKSAFYGMKWPDDFEGKLPFEKPRIALRALTNPTNTRTIIPALVPRFRILPDTAPYLFLSNPQRKQEAYLLGILSSVPLDWYARKFIESKVMNHFLNAFPIPDFRDDEVGNRMVYLSGSLAAVDEQFSDWAEEVGVPIGTLQTEPEKSDAIAELDALVSLAYGLNAKDVVHIFETFHRGWDYQPRLEKVLDFYRQWEDKA